MKVDEVQVAVDALAERVGQSVLIEDARQRPLWWSTTGAVDQTRVQSILHRTVDRRAARVVTDFKLRSAKAPVRVPSIPEAQMWARWCMPVRADGEFLGLVWILDPDETLQPDDLRALVDCAEVAGRQLLTEEKSSQDRRRQRDHHLDRLLAGPDADAARDLILLERLPVDAQVQVTDRSGRTGWPIADGFRAVITESRQFPETSRSTAATASAPAMSGAPLPLVDFAEAVRRARAVRRCLAAGAILEPVSWDGLGGWRLIVGAPETLTPADLHPGADQLAALPQPDLLITARTVLDARGDIAAAAATLHVHRTTLYYRLDRIQQLTGVDLRGGPGCIDLQLALWLQAYRLLHG